MSTSKRLQGLRVLFAVALLPGLISCTNPSRSGTATKKTGTSASKPAPKYSATFVSRIEDGFRVATPGTSTAQIIPVTGQRFATALRLANGAGYTEYNCTPEHLAVAEGDQLIGRYSVRAVSENEEQPAEATGSIYLYGADKNLPLAETSFVADSKWRTNYFQINGTGGIASGEMLLSIIPAIQAQQVDIADIQLFNFGPDVDFDTLPYHSISYPGRDPNAAWRKAAQQRIEEHRKADLSITVVDTKGRIVPNADVHLEMKRHGFPFGVSVNKRLLGADSKDGKAYSDLVRSWFNLAVLENGMKWNQWENPHAPSLKKQTIAAHQWLLDHNVPVHGHLMVWPSYSMQNPLGLEKLPAGKLQERVTRHIQDIGGHFRGQVVSWDVVNEPRSSTEFQDVIGQQAMANWFRTAHRADPGAQLFLNEFGLLSGPAANVDQMKQLVTQLKKQQVPVHGIGLQSHFKTRLPSPEEMLRRLDSLAETGVTLRGSEFDFPTRDEECQADFTRDYYTALFSHPSVESITAWGLWEGMHWQPTAALFRKDWSSKPNAKALAQLLFKDWLTNATGKTDKHGTFKQRGFLGDYEVEVTRNGVISKKRFTLPKGGTTVRIQLGGVNPPEIVDPLAPKGSVRSVAPQAPTKPHSKPTIQPSGLPQPPRVISPSKPGNPPTPRVITPGKSAPVKPVPVKPTAVKPPVPPTVKPTPVKPAPRIPAGPKLNPTPPIVKPTGAKVPGLPPIVAPKPTSKPSPPSIPTPAPKAPAGLPPIAKLPTPPAVKVTPPTLPGPPAPAVKPASTPEQPKAEPVKKTENGSEREIKNREFLNRLLKNRSNKKAEESSKPGQ